MRIPTITAFAVPLVLAAGSVTVSLLLPGRVVAQDAEIVLYDFAGFGGRSITFHESQPDLDPYNWDNDVESIRVVAGTWRIYRDDDYQEFNGPSFELTPGEYPDLEQNPGFPEDRMSSLQLVAAPEPEPEPEPEPVVDAPTPPPVLDPGSPCPAVLDVHWDVTSIPQATGVTWVLLDGNGTELDTGTWNATSGTETIDLRAYGPVLNGTSYSVMIRPPGPGEWLAGWSDPVPFSITTSPGTLEVTRTGGYEVELDWSVGSSIAGCAEEIRYEVHDQAFTVGDGDQPGRLTAGTLGSPSGATTIDLQAWDAGTRWIRLYATGPGGDDVGPRGSPRSVSVPTQGRLQYHVVNAGCGGEDTGVGGTTVLVDGPVRRSGVTNNLGGGGLDLPPGSYSVVATPPEGCQSETETVSIADSTVELDIEIVGCEPLVADADLAVEIRAAPGQMLEGEPLAFAIEVTNEDDRGPAVEREVSLSRVDVKSLRARTPSIRRGRAPKARPLDRETVEAALCPGESRTIMMSDPSPSAGRWAYRAVLSGDDAGGGNDEAATEITVRSARPVLRAVRPDLNPAVTQSHTELPPNATMTYTVEVANEGTGDADDVTVRSEISENLDFLSVNASHGFQCVPSGAIVTCESGDLAADETGTITIRARLPSGAAPGHSLVFGTQTDPGDAIPESDENDNTAGAFAQTAAPPLVVHEMNAGHAMDVAKERGYAFTGRSDPIAAGWCDVLVETFISRRWIKLFAGHPADERPPICVYRLFEGGTLSPGWSIQVDVAEHEGFLSATNPTSWTDDPSFEVRVRSKGVCGKRENPPACSELGARITTVRLRGPEGQNWPAAFPQQ